MLNMTDFTVTDLMNRMPRAFQPDKAEGLDAVIQYHLTGEEGGDWIVSARLRPERPRIPA
jgi:hypothetical protein